MPQSKQAQPFGRGGSFDLLADPECSSNACHCLADDKAKHRAHWDTPWPLSACLDRGAGPDECLRPPWRGAVLDATERPPSERGAITTTTAANNTAYKQMATVMIEQTVE